MKRYLWNVLIAIDELGNAITGGEASETVSSRLGKAKLNAALNNGPWPWYCRYLDSFLDWADPRSGSHALNAIEDKALIARAMADGLNLIFDHDGRIIGFSRPGFLSGGGADL